MTRTDPHRPSAIIPFDYVYVLSYSLPSARGDPGYMGAWRRFVLGAEASGDAPTYFGGLGQCGVCGASYRHGDLWRHTPTDAYVHVGHDCADKYSMLASREEWDAWHVADRKRRAVAIKEERHKKAQLAREAAAAAYRAAHPELEAALQVDHPILRDMANKIVRFGSLSEKQVDFALRLSAEVLERANRPAENHVPAPIGRVTFAGEVVSVKTHESEDWGPTLKMTVKVTTPEGIWLAWMTVPSSVERVERGDSIEVTATLSHGKDPFFAFGKRPTLKKINGEKPGPRWPITLPLTGPLAKESGS